MSKTENILLRIANLFSSKGKKKEKKKKEIPQRPEGKEEEGIYYAWIARDNNTKLSLFFRKPCPVKLFKEYIGSNIILPVYDFPEVTWESGPSPVKIKVEILKE